MKYIFIDEFKGKNGSSLYGLVLVFLDSSKYNLIHRLFHVSLSKSGWDSTEEFKGKYLFCRNPVGQTKTPSQMIKLTSEIIGWLSGRQLSRAKIYYAFNYEGETVDNFLKLAVKMINKIGKSAEKRSGKHLISLYYDVFNGSQKNSEVINKTLDDILRSRGYLLVEGCASSVNSSNSSPGIIYADVCAALCRWVSENPTKTECNLLDLIEHSDKEKINTVHDIYGQIKKIELVV